MTADTSRVGPTGCPISARAAEFDPFSDGYQQNPPGYVAWARVEEPIFYSPVLGYWIVTRYDDVKAIFRDNVTFSPSIALKKITPTSAEAEEVLATYGYAMNRTLVNEDEPAHMPRRRALMAPFTPAELVHHEPMVRRLVREYVDRFVDSGRVDLVDAMLWEVPLTVALHFLGVPEEDIDTLRRYSIAHTVNTWGRPAPEHQVEVAHAVGNFWRFAGGVLDKLRADPSGHGWMPYSLRVQRDQPDVVTDSYLHSMMFAGVVAAHETTANAAANALVLLLTERQVWEELCADPGLIPNAVEECLRVNGSVAAWRRLVTTETTVGGVRLPAGAKLLIMSSSANHDDAHFDDPQSVDVRRDNASDHLTFGYGAHQCMGKNLARMELQIILEELTRRLPHLRLAEQDLTYVPNTSFRGPEHLWVEWDPQANPERRDPSVLEVVVPVKVGEPSRRTLTRPVRVAAVTPVSESVVHLRLEADGVSLPAWTPGAHIDVECGDTGLSRQYSLCGDPAERDVYEIAVLREPDSRGGSAWIHGTVATGDVLHVRGPRNHFRFDPTNRRAIFVAGGIGITPMVAMAAAARESGLEYEVHYLGRSRSHLAFVDDLVDLHGERLRLHLADEGNRADLAAVLAAVPEDHRATTGIYACGPTRMLEALADLTTTWPAGALHVEHFSSTLGELDPSAEHPFEARLADSGITVGVRADQTLLQALRSAGVDVESDCEEGICGSCEVAVAGGAVDHRDLVLTATERAEGRRMMACCSRAVGDSLVLDL